MKYRAIAVLVVFGLLASFAWMLRNELSLDALANQETELRTLANRQPVAVFSAALAVYVLVTALSLPLATVMTLAYAWFFGFVEAVVLVSIGATAGATLAFLASRFLLGEWVQARFRDRLARFNAMLDREGAIYLFALRLTPVVPFVAINLAMGLTRMRVRTFWWVSQIGMLPATCVYASVGASLSGPREIQERGASGLLTWKLAAALVALGLFPLVARRVARPWLKGNSRQDTSAGDP